MRRFASKFLYVAPALRFVSSEVKRYDLFGYEVDTNTQPWIDKIKQCQYYDEAGEVLVRMNVNNCPPDLETYNATLQKIFEAPSKAAEPVENESKFCAMIDLLEEMSHRNKVKPNMESWIWVLKECVQCGQFRLGYCIGKLIEAEFKQVPEELLQQNEANAAKAKAEGNEHPRHMTQNLSIFDIKI
ncbi:unnamed protein product [Phytomonas sp. Hart1]|nr:unnamed protein product [Phytomonas sp. Hart1]|eukprot:CCW72037.1 unnamed protein product [Phytomonas sp. isolate Hart1]